MDLVCLDLEGVLIPEIWIAFAEETGIASLRATTRDIPDYNELMQQRLLKQHLLKLHLLKLHLLKLQVLKLNLLKLRLLKLHC